MKLNGSRFKTEHDVENALAARPSLSGADLLVIGRQVQLRRRGWNRSDLLAIDGAATLFTIEVKRDITPIDTIEQVVAYGAWIQEQGMAWVEDYYAREHSGASLADAFAQHYGVPWPTIDGMPHVRLLIVAAGLDPVTGRAVSALQRHGIPISAVVFNYDAKASTYEFNPLPRPTEIDPIRELASMSLRSALDATLTASWIESDALYRTLGQPSEGSFAHRVAGKVAGIDPIVLASWLLFTADFGGRCAPTLFLFEMYRDMYSRRSRQTPYPAPFDMPRFSAHLAKAVRASGGWVKDQLTAVEIELERERLAGLLPTWPELHNGRSRVGYARSRDV